MRAVKPLTPRKEHHLQARLGLFETTMAGVGYILGAGIYVLIGAVANVAGSAIWLSFIFAALGALATGFSYAELSSMFPGDTSEFMYAKRGLGRSFGFFAMITILLSMIVGVSAVSLGFANYFSALTGFSPSWLIAVIVVLFFGLLNWFSAKDSALFNLVCTAGAIIGLLTIVVLAFVKGATANYVVLPLGFFGVIKGASLIFFAYLGFEGIVKLSEETKNPRKTIPQAMLLSIIISTIVYIAVAIAAVSVLPWDVLAASSAPLADVAAAVLGSKAFVFLGVLALLSTANTILMGLLSSSRGIYGVGKIFPRLRGLTTIGRRDTPTLAIVLASGIALLFLLLKDISVVAEITTCLVFLAFIVVNISVIMLRYKESNAPRPFKMPLNIGRFPLLPVVGLGVSIFLLFNLPKYIIAGGFLLTIFIFVLYKLIRMRYPFQG
ncbi:MAG: APC family permease [Candidatus Nanoarchaeia archaeon]